MSFNRIEKRAASPTEQEVPGTPQLPDRERQISKWNPRSWTPMVRIIVGIVAAVLVVAVVIAGVLGAKANAYPSYSRIEYTLSDTCKF